MAVDTSIYRTVQPAQDDTTQRVGQFIQLGELADRGRERRLDEEAMRQGADAALAGGPTPESMRALVSMNPRAVPYAAKFSDTMRQVQGQADLQTLQQMRGLTETTLDVYKRQLAAGKAEPDAREIANGVYQSKLAGMKLPKALSSGPLAGQPIQPDEVFDPSSFTDALDGFDNAIDTMRGVQQEVQQIDAPQGSRSFYGTPRQAVQQANKVGGVVSKQGTAKASEPSTDIGKVFADYNAGRFGKPSADPQNPGQAEHFRDKALNKLLGNLSPEQAAQEAGKRRSEFIKLTEDARVSNQMMRNMLAAPEDAQGDMTLIYSIGYMRQPGARTMTDSDFRQAASAGGFGDDVKNAMAQIRSTGRLHGDVRKAIMGSGRSIWNQRRDEAQKIGDTYRALAIKAGIDPDQVTLDLMGDVREDEPPAKPPIQPGPAPTPSQAANGAAKDDAEFDRLWKAAKSGDLVYAPDGKPRRKP